MSARRRAWIVAGGTVSGIKRLVKSRLKGFYRSLLLPKIYASDIEIALGKLKVPSDRPVLLHSSLSSCGYFPEGPIGLIAGIRGYLDRDETLVLPTHSWSFVSRGLRDFNAIETPSCVGVVTEWFRKQEGVHRSLHPTHSVAAIGKDALDLTDGHQDAITPCGGWSPYHKLLIADATILFIGAPLESNTSYHCCEGLCSVPYLLQPDKVSFGLTDQKGKQVFREIALHRAGVPRDLQAMNLDLSNFGIAKQHRLGRGLILAIRGKDFMTYLCEKLQRDPSFLLKTKSD